MKWLKCLLGGTGSSPPAEFEALLKETRQHLEGLTFMHQTSLRRGRHDRWDLDTETRNCALRSPTATSWTALPRPSAHTTRIMGPGCGPGPINPSPHSRRS